MIHPSSSPTLLLLQRKDGTVFARLVFFVAFIFCVTSRTFAWRDMPAPRTIVEFSALHFGDIENITFEAYAVVDESIDGLRMKK
jgi:hypothetical protein